MLAQPLKVKPHEITFPNLLQFYFQMNLFITYFELKLKSLPFPLRISTHRLYVEKYESRNKNAKSIIICITGVFFKSVEKGAMNPLLYLESEINNLKSL